MSNSSIFMTLIILLSVGGYSTTTVTGSNSMDPIKIKIILGSTREGRTSDKVAHYIEQILAKRTDICTEIVDLKQYDLDFLSDETPPALRTVITDPLIQRWSDAITNSDAFIIVVPEYNAGYPGVLKNALDALYNEWNNKPVGFVGYSGGSSGGSSAISQLRAVAIALEMVPVQCQITIPTVWKAFDATGNLSDTTIANQLDMIVNQLIKVIQTK